MHIETSLNDAIDTDEVIDLYRANGWSSADKPTALMLERSQGFHQQMHAADGNAVAFYEALGFSRAGATVPMWIYAGTEN